MPSKTDGGGGDGFQVSIDLVAEARSHWAFLKRAYDRKWIHEDLWLRYAIWRYETKWLPLMAEHLAEDIEPPMDVHWVWHVHLLCPLKYVEDCMNVIHCIPDHKLRRTKVDIVKAQENARALWTERYPSDPFEVNTVLPSNYDSTVGNFKSHLSYDIYRAAERQSAFFYNVSLPHYLDDKFLETAAARYKKFVALKRMRPKLFVVPMYDVDLMWHTHQLYPSAYRTDTETYLGRVLNHDDSTTDRGAESKLTLADLETRHAWQEVYGEPFPQPGTLYRGVESVGRLYNLSPTQILELGAIVCKLRIKSVAVEPPNGASKLGGHLLIKSEEFETMDIKLRTKKNKPFEWFSEYREPYFCEFIVDTNFAYTLKVVLRQKKEGILGMMGNKNDLGSLKIDPIPLIEEMPKKSTWDFSAAGATPGGIAVKLTGELCPEFGYRSVVASMHVTPGAFERAVLPEDIEQLWGPFTLPRLPPHVPNDCNVASHKLFSPRGRLVMTVRVVHSLPLRLSAIQVFYGDAMVAVSHLIGQEQLPRPEQLQIPKKCVALNPRVGERAMMIKNNQGDWGIVQTMWRGYNKDGICATSEGHLEVAFTHLRSLRRDRAQVLPLSKGYAPTRTKSFRVAGVTVDLENGTITPSTETVVPESVALAFSVLTLFVLCQPRKDIAEKGKATQAPMHRNILHNSSGEFLNAQRYQLLVASGYHCDTPSNSWLHWHLINHSYPYSFLDRRRSTHTRLLKPPHRDSWTDDSDISSISSRASSHKDDDMDNVRKDRDGEVDDGHEDEMLDGHHGQYDTGEVHTKVAFSGHEGEEHGAADLHDGQEAQASGADGQPMCHKLDGHDHHEEHDHKDHIIDEALLADAADTGDHGNAACDRGEKPDELHEHGMDGVTDPNDPTAVYDPSQACDRDQWMGDPNPWADRGRDGSEENLAGLGRCDHGDDNGPDYGYGLDDDRLVDDLGCGDLGDHGDHGDIGDIGDLGDLGDNAAYVAEGGGEEDEMHGWGDPEGMWDDAAGDGWIGDTGGGDNYGDSGVDGYGVVSSAWTTTYMEDTNWGDIGGGGAEEMACGGGGGNSDDEYDGGEYILDSDGGDSDHGGGFDLDPGGGGCGGGIDDD